MPDVTTMEKMRILRVNASKKRFKFCWNTPCQEHHNKMTDSKEDLLLDSIGNMWCSMVGNFLLFWTWLMGWSSQCSHPSFKQCPHSNNRINPIWIYFGKGKRHILTSVQNFGEICIMTRHDNSHHAKLANHGTQGMCKHFADGYQDSNCHAFKQKLKK